MRSHHDLEMQIAGRGARKGASLAGQSDAAAVAHSGRDAHGQALRAHGPVGHRATDLDALLAAEGGVHELEGDGGVEVRAAARSARAPAAAEAVEDAAHEVVEAVGALEALTPGEAAGEGLLRPARRVGVEARLQGGLAELVVGPALLFVGQYRVGVGGLLEAVLGVVVARVTVRMVLPGDPPVGSAQRVRIDAAIDAESLVEVGH